MYASNGQLVLAVGKEETAICSLSDIPLVSSDTSQERLANILAAVGAAWALDLPADLIRTGLETFEDALALATK